MVVDVESRSVIRNAKYTVSEPGTGYRIWRACSTIASCECSLLVTPPNMKSLLAQIRIVSSSGTFGQDRQTSKERGIIPWVSL